MIRKMQNGVGRRPYPDYNGSKKLKTEAEVRQMCEDVGMFYTRVKEQKNNGELSKKEATANTPQQKHNSIANPIGYDNKDTFGYTDNTNPVPDHDHSSLLGLGDYHENSQELIQFT